MSMFIQRIDKINIDRAKICDCYKQYCCKKSGSIWIVNIFNKIILFFRWYFLIFFDVGNSDVYFCLSSTHNICLYGILIMLHSTLFSHSLFFYICFVSDQLINSKFPFYLLQLTSKSKINCSSTTQECLWHKN